jgi:hypothetical protein
VHWSWEVRRVLVEAVPSTQSVHVVEPGVLEYIPALHGMHTDVPLSPANVPAAHGMHVFIVTAPTAAEYVPYVQSLHAD